MYGVKGHLAVRGKWLLLSLITMVFATAGTVNAAAPLNMAGKFKSQIETQKATNPIIKVGGVRGHGIRRGGGIHRLRGIHRGPRLGVAHRMHKLHRPKMRFRHNPRMMHHKKWGHKKWHHKKWRHKKWHHKKWSHKKWRHKKWHHKKWKKRKHKKRVRRHRLKIHCDYFAYKTRRYTWRHECYRPHIKTYYEPKRIYIPRARFLARR